VNIQALQSGTNLLGVFVIVSDEEKRSVTLTPEGELGVGVGRGLLAPVPGKEGGFDGHEVLHQQVPLFELGQTEKKLRIWLLLSIFLSIDILEKWKTNC